MDYLIKNVVLKELERQKQMKRTYERRRSKVQSFETYRLELNSKNGQTYYYSRKGKERKYLGNQSNETVMAIQEFQLCNTMLEILDGNIRALENLVEGFRWISLDAIQQELPKAYQPKTINNNFIDRRFCSQWIREMTRIKNAYPIEHPENLKTTTCDGTKVRSRVEAMLYDMFVSMGFLVIYEFPIWIDGVCYRPDFTLLHPFLQRIYIWEHLGMWYHESEQRNYRRYFLHKTEEYEKLGFCLGNNLLTSYESANGGINMNRFQDTCYSILERAGEEPVYVDAKKFLQDQRKLLKNKQ